MFHAKRSQSVLLTVMVVLAMTLGLSTIYGEVVAQDSEMTVCDSTLITLLYIAEHDYGYVPMTDVSNIDKGQFTPLFDSMMAMMDEMTATEEAEMDMTEELGGTHLEPGVVEGENGVCTSLRDELEHYLFDHFEHEMMAEGS